MRKAASIFTTIIGATTLGASLSLLPATAGAADADTIKAGKTLSFDRKKGNCLACHAIEGGVSPGDIGPPLLAMKARYESKDALRAQIWDATKKNPESRMPPYGRNKIVSESEIDKIVEFIWTL